MGKQTLRALASGHFQAINTLIVGADIGELHALMALLSATQQHAVCRLLELTDDTKIGCRHLNMAEVAERLGIKECTAREMGRRGEIKTVNYGRAVRVFEPDLESYIEEHRNGLHPGEAGKVCLGLAGSVGETPVAELPTLTRRSRRGRG